jgi:glycosyltransferase involved in cell wall biosynthesis
MPGLIFSVVVPSRGDAVLLSMLLAALENQALSRDAFEVLLALDGAELPESLAPRLAALGGKAIRLDRRRGPGAARNAAAARARAPWLAFTEDDVVPGPGWLSEAAAAIGRIPPPDVIEGITTHPGGRPLRVLPNEAMQYLPTTLFVKREWFERAGGYCEGFFDPHGGLYFREDADLGFTLEELGAVAVREPAIRVTHPEEHPGAWDPVRWAARYVMDPLLARRHRKLFRERIEVHRIGPWRVRRPIVRACVIVVLAAWLAVILWIAGWRREAFVAASIALLLWLPVWAKWRFSPVHLPAALLVPFVLVWALFRGARRARSLGRDASSDTLGRASPRP